MRRVAVPWWRVAVPGWRGNPLLGVRELARPIPESALRRLGERAAHRYPGLHDMGLLPAKKVAVLCAAPYTAMAGPHTLHQALTRANALRACECGTGSASMMCRLSRFYMLFRYADFLVLRDAGRHELAAQSRKCRQALPFTARGCAHCKAMHCVPVEHRAESC